MSELNPRILDSIKRALGIPLEVDVFDSELMMYINASFSKLCQLGVGPSNAFRLEDGSEEWEDFSDNVDLGMVNEFVFMDVKLVFDPPTASVLTSMERMRDELAWRLNVLDDESAVRSEDDDNERDAEQES